MVSLWVSWVVRLLDVRSMAVKYKVWANTLRPNIVNSYYEALTLRLMVLAASGEGATIEPVNP